MTQLEMEEKIKVLEVQVMFLNKSLEDALKQMTRLIRIVEDMKHRY